MTDPAPKRTPWSAVTEDGLILMASTFAAGRRAAEDEDQPEAAAALAALRDLAVAELEQRVRADNPKGR